MPATVKTPGQVLAAELRREFSIGARTRRRRGRTDFRRDIIEAIESATRYPGTYVGARHEAYARAWVIACAWRKHVDGYRIDGVLHSRITQMSPWQLTALLGRMVDAGISNVGEAEVFFQAMACEAYAAAA